ncbi:UphA [Staphylococcus phage Twort]|uniref:UphA n=2 Tax=Staphylococcus phage Twort (strain DSM 17442 / HER 48) TaxID=2908167 RepID=A0A6H0X5G2_BPTWO|nr:ORF221 [Staphylococcus phage Twort]AAX92467.1 ORF221 [Staphylococcus phage Twort]QIW89077.1 UphA [Staphylococcus phage Twort]
MASQKQIYFTQSLVGKALLEDKLSTKEELWEKLELLPETKLEDLDNKQMSQVINTLKEL